MACFSIARVRCLLSNFISRLLPDNSRETVLFGGPDSNRSSANEPAKTDIPMMSKEQSTFSSSSVSGIPIKDSAPIRLHVGYHSLPIKTKL
mgnify:FL=1|jgi:hypothetical protein